MALTPWLITIFGGLEMMFPLNPRVCSLGRVANRVGREVNRFSSNNMTSTMGWSERETGREIMRFHLKSTHFILGRLLKKSLGRALILQLDKTRLCRLLPSLLMSSKVWRLRLVAAKCLEILFSFQGGRVSLIPVARKDITPENIVIYSFLLGAVHV